jgi:GT2 family glycosyltransferase
VLSILVVSFNRRERLRRTLRELASLELPEPHEIIVADNASADGTAEMVRGEFPDVHLLSLTENLGVEAYNRAAAAAAGDLLLLLDDDAWPEPAGLRGAIGAMRREPLLGGIALLPVHPATKRPEWPFARAARHRFPFMGCGNLVRAEAFRRAGGYEPAYFLYRNDTDLALTLLGAGCDVRFDPSWVVWHDSPAAASKSDRWLELATRNWVWLCRRHGRGLAGLLAGVAGVARALGHAGVSPGRLAKVVRGAWAGIATPAPLLPAEVRVDGSALRELLRSRRG